MVASGVSASKNARRSPLLMAWISARTAGSVTSFPAISSPRTGVGPDASRVWRIRLPGLRHPSGEPGDLPHLVHRVQGGDLVGLGQGRVVEDGVDEVVDRA